MTHYLDQAILQTCMCGAYGTLRFDSNRGARPLGTESGLAAIQGPFRIGQQGLPSGTIDDAGFAERFSLAYKRKILGLSPSEAERVRLSEAFDRLSRRETGYDALDERIQKTADKREQLLAVLELPDIPLHNNDMELAARRRVRKRDVSFGPQSRAGARAWDTFQTIAATAAKLGVGLFHYLRDRLVSPETTPSLAERIAERSHLAAQPTG